MRFSYSYSKRILFLGIFAFSTLSSVQVLGEHATEVPAKSGTRPEATTSPRWQSIGKEELKQLGIKDPEAFGEAWKDSQGMIWGDMVMKNDNHIPSANPYHYMTFAEAKAYCEGIGAKLPTVEDFRRLAKYMGGRGFEPGYEPKVLPNLAYLESEERWIKRPHVFWSSSEVAGKPGHVYEFRGLEGLFTYGKRESDTNRDSLTWRAQDQNLVRCVFESPKP